MELDVERWDRAALATAWAAATPFPHVVIDGALDAAQVAALGAAVRAEPHWPERSEIVDGMASASVFQHPTLAGLAAALGAPASLAAVGAITGKPLTRVEVRSYVYLAGGYLLPHTDGRAELGRQVAFAAYLSPDGSCQGGELELYRCTVADGDIVATEPVRVIEHRAGRLVLFDVSTVSLHQIREVTAGARVSLAGWFR